MLLQAAQADNRYIRQRKLSPAEVRLRDRGQLTRLPAFVVGEILGDDFARELEVRGSYFNDFSDHELSPEPLRFESVISTPDGREEILAAGKYQVFVNPFDLEQLFVHDARGLCLGTARRALRVDRADAEAVKHALGRREHQIAELKKPMLQRHQQMMKDETSRLAHNAKVIDLEQPFTVEEQESAAFIRQEGAAAAADILAPQQPDPADVSAAAAVADADVNEFLSAISGVREPKQ